MDARAWMRASKSLDIRRAKASLNWPTLRRTYLDRFVLRVCKVESVMARHVVDASRRNMATMSQLFGCRTSCAYASSVLRKGRGSRGVWKPVRKLSVTTSISCLGVVPVWARCCFGASDRLAEWLWLRRSPRAPL